MSAAVQLLPLELILKTASASGFVFKISGLAGREFWHAFCVSPEGMTPMKKHAEQYKLMNIRQVAVELGVSTKTLRRLIKDGQFPAFKVGRQWRMRESQLYEWIRKRENTGQKVTKMLALDR